MARKAGLDLDDVVLAAAAIADAQGLDALTLAAVADVLGVRSPSLYSHVDGLAGLRRELAVHAAHRLGAVLGDAEGLAALAHAYRAFAIEHPGLYAAMLPTPDAVEDPGGYQAFAAVARAVGGVFAGMDLEDDELVHRIRTVRSALHGFVSLHAGGGFGMPQDVDTSFDRMVDVLVACVAGTAGDT